MIQEIRLPGGDTVLARVSVLDPGEVPGGADEFSYEDVGALDHICLLYTSDAADE